MDYSALTHIPLFGQITPDELEGIFNELNIHENSFKKGEILALQDEPANRLIILLKGSVKAEMTDPSGKVVKGGGYRSPQSRWRSYSCSGGEPFPGYRPPRGSTSKRL